MEFDEEADVLQKKVLIINGKAGTGKSQLFATTANLINSTGGSALLLLGHKFINNLSIQEQILSTIGLDISFDSFLQILECIGYENDCCVTIFIDAINESSYKEIWQTGLITIINKINKFDHIRLAVSVRSDYEPLVFDDSIKTKIKNKELLQMTHMGFQDDSFNAIKSFLDHYSIPFSPLCFLSYEMTNPLFLTLFCRVYEDGEFNIYGLFDKLIESVDKEVQKAINSDGTIPVLKHFIYEMVDNQLGTNNDGLTKEILLGFKFWEIYGLSYKKLNFLSSLLKSGLLITFVDANKNEHYRLAYNLLENFMQAKRIIERYDSKDKINAYIKKSLLKIENGQVTQPQNLDTFIILCGLHHEKFDGDCIDIIDDIENDCSKLDIIKKYFQSFSWQRSQVINSEYFLAFKDKYNSIIQKYAPNNYDIFEVLFDTLIETSTKPNHPLNADFLHTILFEHPLNERDRKWTMYINRRSYDTDRIYQLISFFDEGNNFDNLDTESVRLLLILFSWILSSSYRLLRDRASKALIELLKNNFNLCEYLLKKFDGVNDPYILQRLYGVVFGACMKRNATYKDEFKTLAEYVFKTIFNTEYVYPDILLRDYAKLIIERYLYEYPNSKCSIIVNKINPPYKSKKIPNVSKCDDDGVIGGILTIKYSMQPNRRNYPCYGDFGRYVFQRALNSFEGIDIDNLYHYAIQFIINELGYTDEMFANYDKSVKFYNFGRQPSRNERIGKKYQWIAFYNILARISDTQKLKSMRNNSQQFYNGAWEPYVRDFDPTLNRHFLVPRDLPKINFPQLDETFISRNVKDLKSIRQWLKTPANFFSSFNSYLLVEDTDGNKWVSLYYYIETKDQPNTINDDFPFNRGEQQIWCMAQGYFVNEDEFVLLKRDLEQRNFLGRWFAEPQKAYELFNREYAWSLGYNTIFGQHWFDYEIGSDNFTGITNSEIKNTKSSIVRIMPTYTRCIWEEEYDASKSNRIAFNILRKDIIDHLELEQKVYDGCLYSTNGELVSFDGELTKISKSLFIRKDYLCDYLRDKKLKVFWTFMGEKIYFNDHPLNLNPSEWSGLFWLEEDSIQGAAKIKDS
ncbi:hypothetical protein [Treponema phagedenis]|uniref:hypothetical protein n=1 Tax=Treponema phagedenis TaxID=162 RepID=UPI00125251FC|nr:hypothetical protein [Treponema phagedenis]TYT78818.1 hypothetical protein FS559_06655 [Treponema phagedenis]